MDTTAAADDAAELALEASLSFLDDYEDYEAITSEWLAPQALDSAETDVDVLPAGESVSEHYTTSAAVSSAGRRQNNARSRSRAKLSSIGDRQGARAAAGPRNSNRARDERKYELIFMRRHVEELEAQLCEATWKETAQRLRAERQLSEKENIRLRLLVDRQLRTARRLEKMVSHKRGVKDNAKVVSDPLGFSQDAAVSTRRSLLMDMMPSPVLFESTEQTFDMLLRGTERARDEVEAVFSATGLSAINKGYRSAKVEQDATNGTVLEFVASKLLASDVSSVHQAAWRHFGYSQPQMPYRTLSEYHDERKDLDFAEDTIAASYGLELFNGIESVKFDEWRVLRRFVDGDRVVLVLCTLAEVTEFAGAPTTGIRVLERAYVVLRPSLTGGVESSCTLMQTCYRTQPVMYKDTPSSEDTMAALTDFLFAFVAGTVSVNHQMIEKALRAAQSRMDTESWTSTASE